MNQDLKVLFPVIVGAILASIGSFLNWNRQIKFDKKKIVKGLYLELTISLEPLLKHYYDYFMNNPNQPFDITRPIYNEGLFFDFKKEIFTLDNDLLEIIFKFYYYIIQAEKNRNIKQEDTFYEGAKAEMIIQIKTAYELIPELKSLLDNYIYS